MTFDGAIAIDLGTTQSRVAVWQHEKVVVIPNEQGRKATPSCVAFRDGERMIGDAAASQAVMNPANTIMNVKRLLGKKFSDPEVQADIKFWPFKVTRGGDDRPLIEIQHCGEVRQFMPEEVTSMVIGKMKEIAESFLGKAVRRVLITVPASFNIAQRQATKDAGEIAGLEVLRVLNEPTAAAVVYVGDASTCRMDERNVLIFHLGGGALDATVVKIDDGVVEVTGSCGDSHLGGEDFDSRLLDHFIGEFPTQERWQGRAQQPTCAPPPAYGMRACKAHPVVGATGIHRHRLVV